MLGQGRRCSGLFAMLTGFVFMGPAFAQPDPAAVYPVRAIRMVVPFPPGASTDTTALIVSQRMSENWGQPVVVDNKSGASGIIGLDFVAKSPTDGYTLGVLIVGHLTLDKAPYDLTRDFAPVSQLTSNTYVLVVTSKISVRTIAELVALAKAKPNTIRFGSSGQGGVIHLAAELFASLAKVKMTHVPYKGNAPAMIDVGGGHIEMLIAGLPTVAPLVSAGQARALGVTSSKRLASAPDLPTIQEAGVPGYEVEGWYGLIAPAGVPAPVVDKLSREIARILAVPDTRDKFAADGTFPVSSTPAQFGAYIRSENEKWRKVIRDAGLSMN